MVMDMHPVVIASTMMDILVTEEVTTDTEQDIADMEQGMVTDMEDQVMDHRTIWEIITIHMDIVILIMEIMPVIHPVIEVILKVYLWELDENEL